MEMNNYDSPFLDPELRPESRNEGTPSYYIDSSPRTREEGTWVNGWSVSWFDYMDRIVYATAIQVGTQFFFMPMFPEFAPGFKTFAEMREIVKEIQVLAAQRKRERQEEFRKRLAEQEAARG